MSNQQAAPTQSRFSSPQDLVERYDVAMWNEAAPDLRRQRVRELWADDGEQILQPPLEMREAVARLGFPLPSLQARGYASLEARVSRAHEEFVQGGQYVFRARKNAERLGDHLKFNWEMVSTDAGEVVAVGLEVLVLDDEDRIRVDYQFIEP